MSQISNIFRPWVLVTSTVLLVGAAYAPNFLQWYATQPKATATTPLTTLTSFPSNVPSQMFNRPAYFSDAPSKDVADQTVQQPLETSQSEPSKNPSITYSVQPSEMAVQDAAHKQQQESVAQTSDKRVMAKPVVAPEVMPSLDAMMQGMVIIEYENELVIEFNKQVFSEKLMQALLVRIMLSADVVDQFQLLQAQADNKAFNSRAKPFFYPRIRNALQDSVRYPAQAFEYASDLLKNKRTEVVDENSVFVQIAIALQDFPKVTEEPSLAAKFDELPYLHAVNRFSREFMVDQTLIYAIMEVESAFNPMAVSSSNALGLMQVKADSAGKDVYRYIDGKDMAPTEQSLFNPQENIRVGTAYLSLLNDMYFASVSDEKKKELLVIAAYNGGLNKVFALFGKTQAQAIEQVNRMSLQAIYQVLTTKHPSSETKAYVAKVKKAQQKYQKQLG